MFLLIPEERSDLLCFDEFRMRFGFFWGVKLAVSIAKGLSVFTCRCLPVDATIPLSLDSYRY
jgi:hypothetical protein